MVGLYLVLPSDTKRGITAIRHLSTVKSQTIEQYAIWLRLAPSSKVWYFYFLFFYFFRRAEGHAFCNVFRPFSREGNFGPPATGPVIGDSVVLAHRDK